MEVGILLTYFAVSCSSLSEDSAEFRYVPLYPASRVSFDLPRQIGKRKETLRAASRFFDPPLIRENG